MFEKKNIFWMDNNEWDNCDQIKPQFSWSTYNLILHSHFFPKKKSLICFAKRPSLVRFPSVGAQIFRGDSRNFWPERLAWFTLVKITIIYKCMSIDCYLSIYQKSRNFSRSMLKSFVVPPFWCYVRPFSDPYFLFSQPPKMSSSRFRHIHK